MAKETALSKKLKISEAQQYMLLAVLGASIICGVAIALIMHFTKQISLNTKAIMAQEESIVAYTNVIKDAGVCIAPKGGIYSDQELEACEPESIEISQIPGTLRANILGELAANKALNSVPKEDNANCLNNNGQPLTYKELIDSYRQARGAEQLQAASNRIKICSALRVIPDALPAFKNEEALLASLNKLYIIANWEPESISSSGSTVASETISGLNGIIVNSKIEADTGTAMKALTNIERSIREFDIHRANIEWTSASALTLQFEAAAYYTDESTITETNKTITLEGK